MKILMVHSTEKVSGGENVSLNIARSLKEEFSFCFFAPAEPISKDKFDGFSVFYPKNGGLVNSVTELKKVIREQKPDLVHAQGTRAAMFVKFAFISGTKKIKFLYTLHGIHFINRPFPLDFISVIYERLTNCFVSGLICVGKDDFDLARRLRLIRSGRLFLIDNGINIKTEVADKTTAEKVIVSVSRLHYQKDIGSLIKAAYLLNNKDVKFLIVGDGPERKELEKLTEKLDLKGRVDFLGNREDVGRILSLSDVFVLSTNWEGQPLVILEAWASKKPVVASNVHGVKDLVENGKTGLLFRHKDPADLANKIDYLLDNKEVAKRMGENGYNLVKSKYTTSIMSENYQMLYKETLND